MKYFAMIAGQQVGPSTIDELASIGLMPDTYVWCKGMDDWHQAREVGDICRYFRIRIYDKMHPSTSESEVIERAEVIENNNEVSNEAPLRFRRIIEKSGEVPVASDTEPDYSQMPSTWFPFPLVIAMLLFPPLGVVGVINALRARHMWKTGRHKEAHEFARQAKLFGGVAFFIGVIILSALIRFI